MHGFMHSPLQTATGFPPSGCFARVMQSLPGTPTQRLLATPRANLVFPDDEHEGRMKSAPCPAEGHCQRCQQLKEHSHKWDSSRYRIRVAVAAFGK